jgi:hypothetical protein
MDDAMQIGLQVCISINTLPLRGLLLSHPILGGTMMDGLNE